MTTHPASAPPRLVREVEQVVGAAESTGGGVCLSAGSCHSVNCSQCYRSDSIKPVRMCRDWTRDEFADLDRNEVADLDRDEFADLDREVRLSFG